MPSAALYARVHALLYTALHIDNSNTEDDPSTCMEQVRLVGSACDLKTLSCSRGQCHSCTDVLLVVAHMWLQVQAKTSCHHSVVILSA